MRDQKWQIIGFGVSLAAIAMMDVFIWPSYRDTLQQIDLPDALQAFLGSDLSIATPAGFLSAEFFSWMPILMLVYAIIQGTGAIAGEEGSGTMDLLLAQPIRRTDVVLGRTAAVVCGTAAILAIACVGWFLSIPFVSIDISLGSVVLATANILPITLLFFALSLWLGAIMPSRSVAVAITVGLATAAYFVNAIATGVQSLQNFKYATPFYYYGSGQPLVDGLNWLHIGLLMMIAIALVAAAVASFAARDVGTGGSSDLDLVGRLRGLFSRAEANPAA
jgi:ABC-2 type transport system permease protein